MADEHTRVVRLIRGKTQQQAAYSGAALALQVMPSTQQDKAILHFTELHFCRQPLINCTGFGIHRVHSAAFSGHLCSKEFGESHALVNYVRFGLVALVWPFAM